MAPTIESKPPKITAGKTLIPIIESELDTPLTIAITTPAVADTVAAIPQLMANTCFTEIPKLCAICWSKAVARMAKPYLECLKNK